MGTQHPKVGNHSSPQLITQLQDTLALCLLFVIDLNPRQQMTLGS